jgi:predicted HTH domain antitoxin
MRSFSVQCFVVILVCITLGQAAQLASVSQAEMMRLLAARAIPLHYDELSFEQDLQTLRSFK